MNNGVPLVLNSSTFFGVKQGNAISLKAKLHVCDDLITARNVFDSVNEKQTLIKYLACQCEQLDRPTVTGTN